MLRSFGDMLEASLDLLLDFGWDNRVFGVKYWRPWRPWIQIRLRPLPDVRWKIDTFTGCESHMWDEYGQEAGCLSRMNSRVTFRGAHWFGQGDWRSGNGRIVTRTATHQSPPNLQYTWLPPSS